MRGSRHLHSAAQLQVACVRGQAHAGKVGQRLRRRLVMLIVDADVGVSVEGIVHRWVAYVTLSIRELKVKTDLADDVSAFEVPAG